MGSYQKLLTYLKKVYCSPYIHGCIVKLLYSPNGGIISEKIKASSTKFAGRRNCWEDRRLICTVPNLAFRKMSLSLF